ncbi:hypothetical protein G6F57_023596 [Rhizopus arrhizus]|nr:hypothetical protein G6F57_023596 [Rhizopus arrhizus]
MTLRGFDAALRHETADGCDAGVVDDERHVRRMRRGGRHVVRIRHVQLDRFDARQGDGRRIACAGIDFARPPGQRLAGKGQP